MWWLPLITAGAGLYMGQQQQKAQERARKDQALINMYAPLFGKAPVALGVEQDHVTPGLLNGAISGYEMMADYQKDKNLEKLYSAMAEKKSASPQAAEPVFVPYNATQTNVPRPWQRVDANTFFNNYYQP